MCWVHADLTTMQLDRRFSIVAMAGNVMNFCRIADRSSIVHNAAAHLEDAGLLVAGFALEHGRDALSLLEYDGLCEASGLQLLQRCSTWSGHPYRGEAYAVSVHRAPGGD